MENNIGSKHQKSSGSKPKPDKSSEATKPRNTWCELGKRMFGFFKVFKKEYSYLKIDDKTEVHTNMEYNQYNHQHNSEPG